jgi:carboxyl-terminal processing protease
MQTSKNSLFSIKRIWLVSFTVLVLFTSAVVGDQYFEISKNMEIFNSVYKELNMFYVDETQPANLMQTGIDAMLRSLDPYTVYYPESKIENAMFMQTGQYGGIGTLVNTIQGKITITEPYQGYPAAKAGLMAGDVVTYINAISVVGKKHEEVSDLLMGQPGSDVELTIQRLGENNPLKIKLKREEIKIPDVPYFNVLEDGQTGYIKLTGFTQTASNDVREAFVNLKKKNIQRCILDLRGNGGGLLREAINIVNFFVPKGTEIVQTRGKMEEWNKTYTALNEPLDVTMPLIVLVDEMSASASEIVSGSLQDLDRAVVVGNESFGKGLVQQTKDLAYNTKMKLTVAKYYTPSGRCIQRLDYSHRDQESGKVEAVSDSLVRIFKTMNGRIVKDGRGIQPDVLVEPEEMSHILGGLLDAFIIFDYATVYRQQHASIDSAYTFRLTETDYNGFLQFAMQRSFDYNTHTESLYKELRKVAEEEKYYQGHEKEFDALFKQIEPDKQRDLLKFKSQIKEMIENEIVSRYYYQDGRIKHSMPQDPVLKKAMDVFGTTYSALLAAPVKK